MWEQNKVLLQLHRQLGGGVVGIKPTDQQHEAEVGVFPAEPAGERPAVPAFGHGQQGAVTIVK